MILYFICILATIAFAITCTPDRPNQCEDTTCCALDEVCSVQKGVGHCAKNSKQCPTHPATAVGRHCVRGSSCEYGELCCCSRCFPASILTCTMAEHWALFHTPDCAEDCQDVIDQSNDITPGPQPSHPVPPPQSHPLEPNDCKICPLQDPSCDSNCKHCEILPSTCHECAEALCLDHCVRCPLDQYCDSPCEECFVTRRTCSSCGQAICLDQYGEECLSDDECCDPDAKCLDVQGSGKCITGDGLIGKTFQEGCGNIQSFVCPETPGPLIGEECTAGRCEYGRVCCCEKCFPSLVLQCDGVWSLFSTDACADGCGDPSKFLTCEECVENDYAWSFGVCIEQSECPSDADACWFDCKEMIEYEKTKETCDKAQNCYDCVSYDGCYWKGDKCNNECSIFEEHCGIQNPKECRTKHCMQCPHHPPTCLSDCEECLVTPGTCDQCPTAECAISPGTMEFVFKGKSLFDGTHLIFKAQERGGDNFCKVEITFNSNLLQDMYDVQTPKFEYHFKNMWITVYDKFKRKLKATKVPDRDKLHFLIQAYHPIQHLLVGVVHSPSTFQSPLDVNVNFESRLYPIGAEIREGDIKPSHGPAKEDDFGWSTDTEWEAEEAWQSSSGKLLRHPRPKSKPSKDNIARGLNFLLAVVFILTLACITLLMENRLSDLKAKLLKNSEKAILS